MTDNSWPDIIGVVDDHDSCCNTKYNDKIATFFTTIQKKQHNNNFSISKKTKSCLLLCLVGCSITVVGFEQQQQLIFYGLSDPGPPPKAPPAPPAMRFMGLGGTIATPTG